MDTSELDPIRQYSGTRPDKQRNINPMPEPEPEPEPGPEPPFVYTPIEREPVFPDYGTFEPVVPPVNPIAPPPVSPIAPPPVSPFPAPPPSPFPAPVPAFQQGIGSFVSPPALPTDPSMGRTYGAVPTDPSNLSMVPPDQLFGG